MPVLDTEVLFAFNPNDKKHKTISKILRIKGLKVPDTALLEFQIVLKARGRSCEEIREAMEALKFIFSSNKIKEVKTISTDLIILQSEIEEKYGLSYFDSLIASSALMLDKTIVSDDKAFDKIPNLRRIPLS